MAYRLKFRSKTPAFCPEKMQNRRSLTNQSVSLVSSFLMMLIAQIARSTGDISPPCKILLLILLFLKTQFSLFQNAWIVFFKKMRFYFLQVQVRIKVLKMVNFELNFAPVCCCFQVHDIAPQSES
jgi:hypothetical protein